MTRYNPEKDRAKLAAWKDPVLEEERAWIIEGEQEIEEGAKQDKGKGKSKAPDGGAEEEPEMEDGEGIECQCCFCDYPFVCTSFLSYRAPIIVPLPRLKWSNARKPISSA